MEEKICYTPGGLGFLAGITAATVAGILSDSGRWKNVLITFIVFFVVWYIAAKFFLPKEKSTDK